MASAAPVVHRWVDIDLDKVTEMVSRKDIVDGPDACAQIYFKKGALVARHAHAGPQWIYVLQGAMTVTIADQPVTLREGDVVRIPPGVLHQAEALDDTFVLDIRSAARP